jgi:hypothetical protein
MVRFSTQQPGFYTITAMSEENALKHYRIKHKAGLGFLLGNAEYPSLPKLIKANRKELYLKVPTHTLPFISSSFAFVTISFSSSSRRHHTKKHNDVFTTVMISSMIITVIQNMLNACLSLTRFVA